MKLALAHWWIIQGNLNRASYLVQGLGLTRDDEIPYSRELEYLLLLTLLLAQGKYDAVRSLAERLLHMAEAAKRVGRVIKILVLQALAFQGMRDMDQALSVLGKALALAQPEGYCRVFLDEGEPMAKLLFQAKAHRIGQGYAAELLSALGEASSTSCLPLSS